MIDLAAKKDGGAVFTTDATSTDVNKNLYESKDDVYLNGGPDEHDDDFEDSTYYVQVTEPNGTVLGRGSITITGGSFHYQLSAIVNHDGTPGFADTTNEGGEYKVWVSTDASFPNSASKTDNFKVVAPDLPDPGTVIVGKYYDANTDGAWTPGEPGIAGWPIQYTAADGTIQTVVTQTGGKSTIDGVDPGTYPFAEVLAQAPWIQTGPSPVRTHEVKIVDGDTVEIAFGNVAIGAGVDTHHTIGFWSNKNGKAQVAAVNGEVDELAALTADNLVKADGKPFDPTKYSDVPTWLLNATATNMKYMLSAQLAAMHLSVVNGFVSQDALVYAPGTESANGNGFATIGALIAEANTALTGSDRAYQETIKNVLDKANNNTNFVVPFGSIPAPVFA
jgi:hypothetical protein